MSEGIRETYIEQHVPYMLSCVTLLVPYNILNAYPKKMGTSLVIQWLRRYATNAGHQGSMPGEGTRSHMLHLRPNTAK